MIAGDHLDIDAHVPRLLDRIGSVLSRRIEKRQQTEKAPGGRVVLPRDAQRAVTFRRKGVDRGMSPPFERGVGLDQCEDDLGRALG